MNTKLISKSLISAVAVSSMMLLASAPTQAAPTQAEIEAVYQAQALKEAGWTFPAIEEAMQIRKAAIARAEAEKVAKAKDHSNAAARN